MVSIVDLDMPPQLAHALGWTIIHSLWQVAFMALVMSGVHRVVVENNANRRYVVAIGAMIGSLVLSVITFGWYMSPKTESVQWSEGIGSATAKTIKETTHSLQSISWLEEMNAWVNAHLHHINTLWMVGVVLFFLKFLISWVYVVYLKGNAETIDDKVLQLKMKELQQKLGLSRFVALKESALVTVPMVMGYLKPMVLFPAGMVTMLEIEEIESILVHEMTHIKRNDYVVNLVVSIVEVLYFYHPAAWWISANIKSERENCCDDAVVRHSNSAMNYAKVLVKLEELRRTRNPRLAIAFASNKNQLMNRVKRILNMKQTKNDMKEKGIATVMLFFMMFVLTSGTLSESIGQKSSEVKAITANSLIEIEIEDGQLKSLIRDGKNDSFSEVELDKVLRDNAADSGTSFIATMSGNPLVEYNESEITFFADEMVLSFDEMLDLAVDTLPIKKRKKMILIQENDDHDVEVTKENGEVTMLKIDGKVIPKHDYDKHKDIIEDSMQEIEIDIDVDDFQDIGEGMRLFNQNMDSMLNSGSVFFMDLDDMESLSNMLEEFDGGIFNNLEGFESFENLEQLKNMDGLEDMMDGLSEMMNGLNLDDDSMIFKFENGDLFADGIEMLDLGQSTTVDVLSRELNEDGLLEEHKTNKIELSGKCLRINGDKMPKPLFNKYKRIYQDVTGAPLTKSSKMVFSVEGQPVQRRIKSF